MIDTLEKMSGKTHRAYGDSKMITRNLARIFFQNEDNSSVTISVKEEPVVKYNDLAFLSERNSIVFRAGDPPIWNRNELILPMSWRLFLNKIEHPGRDYSLQTIPTLSSAIDFDVRKNQPDFEAMVNKRLSQAIYAEEARELYKQVFGYSDYDVAQLDPDIYADSVMDIISARINADSGHDADDYVPDANVVAKTLPHTELNQEQIAEAKRIKSENQKFSKAIYAKGRLSRDDIAQFDQGGRILWISHSLDVPLSECFKSNRREFERDTAHFQVRDGNLYDANGRMLYISKAELSDAEASTISRGIYDRDIPVYSEDKVRPADVGGYIITDGFYRFLLQQDSWNAIAGGVIERAIAKHLE